MKSEGRGFYVHPECLAVMLLHQCDPGDTGDDRIPMVCEKCVPRRDAAEARAKELLDIILEHQAANPWNPRK